MLEAHDTTARRMLDALGAANGERSRIERRSVHRVIAAVIFGILIGLGLILIFGDVSARTAAIVLQAEEAREW